MDGTLGKLIPASVKAKVKQMVEGGAAAARKSAGKGLDKVPGAKLAKKLAGDDSQERYDVYLDGPSDVYNDVVSDCAGMSQRTLSLTSAARRCASSGNALARAADKAGAQAPCAAESRCACCHSSLPLRHSPLLSHSGRRQRRPRGW